MLQQPNVPRGRRRGTAVTGHRFHYPLVAFGCTIILSLLLRDSGERRCAFARPVHNSAVREGWRSSWHTVRTKTRAPVVARLGAQRFGSRRTTDGKSSSRGGRTRVIAFAAQDAIRSLMAKHDPILLYVSKLLQPDIASDAGALYAWCRRLDELVDDPAVTDASTTRERLDEWKLRLDELWAGSPRDEMDAALLSTLQRHPSLGLQPFNDMLKGMRADAVDTRRIATNNELDEYAYQVAGTVGLMLLPLLGVDKDEDVARLRKPAIALGQAIQLINILRDARPDAALGRIYLPQDEMQDLGINEDDVIAGKSTPAYFALVERTAARAESFLQQAEASKLELPGVGPLLVSIIVELYRDYLTELSRRGYDNLSKGGDRVSISTPRKVLSTLRAVSKLLLPTT